jgi:hypothetical protein
VVFAPPLLAAEPAINEFFCIRSGEDPTKRSGLLEVIDPIIVMAALADSTSYLLIDLVIAWA